MADAALVNRLRPGDHVFFSFADDAERRRLTAAYVRAGLRHRDKVVYLTSLPGAEQAITELSRAGVDTAAALRSGRITVAGADDTYLAGGRFDPEAAGAMFADEVRRARRAGFSGLRALGDMAWAVRGAPGSEHLAGYERQVNRLYADGYAMAVCLYDRRLFGPPRLSELARAHPAAVTPRTSRTAGPLLRMVRQAGGLRLSGEADLSNRDALATVLTHLLEDSSAPVVTLDLTDLRFADATSCELIVRTAREAAGRLRTTGTRPSVRRLLRLQGGASVPGLLDCGRGQTPVG
jgi:anti-anti-sigma factor